MKLYYENDHIKLYCGNCLNWKTEKVDHIITDPPYGIKFENNSWDQSFDMNNFFHIFKDSLKENGNAIIFQGWSNVNRTIDCFINEGYNFNNWIIWDRIKGRGAKKNFVSTREDILWFSNGKNYVFNPVISNIKKKTGGTIGRKNGCEYRKLSNVWYDISPIVPWSPERVKHPTQKPIQLLERIIKIFTNEQDIILDLFAGSGTTGLACMNLNRRCILIEQNEEYCEVIKKRFINY